MLLFALIILLGLMLRWFACINNTYMNAEAPINFAMMRQTILNHFIVPKVNVVSGFPIHNPFLESPYLILIGIIPFWLSGGILSLMQSVAIVQAIFALVGMVVVYSIAKKMIRSDKWALFAMLLFALQPIAITNNTFNMWQGDCFVPTLTALAMLILLHALEQKDLFRKGITMGISLLPLVLAWYLWSGGVFALVSYAFAFMGILCFRLIKSRKLAFVLVVGSALLAWTIWFLFISVSMPMNIDTYPSFQNAVKMLTQTGTIGFTRNLFYISYLSMKFPIDVIYPMILVIGFAFSGFLLIVCLVEFISDRIPLDKGQIDAFAVLLALLAVAMPFTLCDPRWNSLLPISMAILAMVAISQIRSKHLWLAIVILDFSFVFVMLTSTLPGITLTPSYQNTMLWIANNTKENATFLTWGYDGAMLEGYANRVTFSDAYDNYTWRNDYNFSRFLYAKMYNFSYLAWVKPDYFIVRGYWYESEGYRDTIYQEGRFNSTYSDALFNNTNFELFSYRPKSFTIGNMSFTIVYDEPKGYEESTIYKVDYHN